MMLSIGSRFLDFAVSSCLETSLQSMSIKIVHSTCVVLSTFNFHEGNVSAAC